MRTKAAFVVGAAVGYVLGTRAGREKFEEIRAQARKMWEDPRVQDTVSDLEDKAAGTMRTKGPELKDKVTDAVKSATGAAQSKVKAKDTQDSGPTSTGSTSTGSAPGVL